MKPGTLSSKTDIYKIAKGSDERNRINMIDVKKSDERDHIGENDEDILTYDIDFSKLVNRVPIGI